MYEEYDSTLLACFLPVPALVSNKRISISMVIFYCHNVYLLYYPLKMGDVIMPIGGQSVSVGDKKLYMFVIKNMCPLGIKAYIWSFTLIPSDP
jgi:hypothetical protein